MRQAPANDGRGPAILEWRPDPAASFCYLRTGNFQMREFMLGMWLAIALIATGPVARLRADDPAPKDAKAEKVESQDEANRDEAKKKAADEKAAKEKADAAKKEAQAKEETAKAEK